jgi:hypothetical protein
MVPHFAIGAPQSETVVQNEVHTFPVVDPKSTHAPLMQSLLSVQAAPRATVPLFASQVTSIRL